MAGSAGSESFLGVAALQEGWPPAATMADSAFGSTTPPATAGMIPLPELPSLGAMPSQIEQQQEVLLGEMVLRQVARQVALYEDAWLQDQLQGMFNGIYGSAGLGKPLGLMIINDSSINAFAAPGGLFALHTGLIASVRTPDELAGVISHEIAHVSQRHYSRSKAAMKNQGWLSLGGLLASILLASQSAEAASAVAIGTQAAMIDQQLSYSRNQEREADRVGMQLMYRAGYQPVAMADFFETMQRKSGTVGFLPDFWLTHPLSTERMSEARLRASQYQAQGRGATLTERNLNQQHILRLMQYRMAVFTGQINEKQLVAAVGNDAAARLPLASFYTLQGNFKAARQLIDQARQMLTHSDLDAGEAQLRQTSALAVAVAITTAENELAARQPQHALDAVLPVARILPENRALNLYVAKALMGLGQSAEALERLQALAIHYPRDAMLWQTMEQAASLLPASDSKGIHILRYRAENQFWRGQVDAAIRSLIRANALAQSNASLQAKIASRLSQMQSARQLKPTA